MKLQLSIALASWLVIQSTTAYPAIGKRMADFESVRTRLDRSYVNPDHGHPNKYFHESTFHQHYDGRFADRPLKYDKKQAYLSALVQTYLSTMSSIGAETWLMHGTLLGWYWNRRIMPWDSDIDVMISEPALHFLAAYHNMTVRTFKFPRQERRRSYLLEINPHYADGDVRDRDNRIDARWIDMDIGLFIDITTLRENRTAGSEDEEMSVKDNHRYLYDDIFPLRESVFEGVAVSIPFAYPEVLAEEYGDEALSGINHENHRYNVEKQAWEPQAVLSSSEFDKGMDT